MYSKLLKTLALPSLLLGGALSGLAHAEEAAAVVEVVAEAAAPSADPGNTAWVMISTALVFMMILPGLALFYGGMVRSKNVLSVLSQTLAIVGVIAILWVVYGYSMAFTSGGGLNSFIGGFSKMFLSGVDTAALAETFSKDVFIPELSFVIFQLTFAAITVALVVGGLAERVKFSALLVFAVLWFTFSYLPMAHMVWFWGGPSAYADPAGLLFSLGALDFAGGTVVHINAGVAALMGAIVLGKRIGFGKEPMPPHNLVLTMIGAALLWVGWFGFNAGSNPEATGTAAMAILNTIVAPAAALLAWGAAEWLTRGKPSMLGMASGAVAGLVAITPAAGFSGPMGAILLGLAVGVIAFWAVGFVKRSLKIDDSLDVFAVHGIGGIVGAIGTGIVANPAFGGSGVFDYAANAVAEFSPMGQVMSQLMGVGVAVLWSGIVSFVLFKLIDMTMGLRVSEETEREGLDTASHGERAYSN